MNPPRHLAALPLALVLFWTMVVAPLAIARCEHACGEIRLHALGALCADDHDGCGDHARPDDRHGDPTRTRSGSCQLFQADDAPASDHTPTPKPPPLADFVPVYPVSLTPRPDLGEPTLSRAANAPPDFPPGETHGPGARPLLI